MLALTLFSQYWIISRMDTLRAKVSDFAAVAAERSDPHAIRHSARVVHARRRSSAGLGAGSGLSHRECFREEVSDERFSVLGSQFSVLGSQFSVLSSN